MTKMCENHDDSAKNGAVSADSRCLVVVGGVQGLRALCADDWDFSVYELVICGDSGQDVARALGIVPDVYIGDFDSSPRPAGQAEFADGRTRSPEVLAAVPVAPPSQAVPGDGVEVIILPAAKEVTDSEAAVDLAYSRGYRHIDVIGGLGGRLDHTLGNLGILAKFAHTPARLRWIDGYNMVSLVGPGTHMVPRNDYQYFGLIPFDGDVEGLTLTGTRYLVEDFTLVRGSTRGVSNEITGQFATVSFTSGRLLMVSSRDLQVSGQ
ncbi:thiamine diphosphokinase [uncultured Mobiluncus sp.]|uniref:thiamine diphosphokinase n=1 Tax=uncultured Mobiluncus sp. TaxID=293425 RepID=UPI00260F9026|nr:thiamine diphosphokinase [uncultured Mobiluncus sp.]